MTPIEHLRAHEREMNRYEVNSRMWAFEFKDLLRCDGVGA